jgi:hypothetical protein
MNTKGKHSIATSKIVKADIKKHYKLNKGVETIEKPTNIKNVPFQKRTTKHPKWAIKFKEKGTELRNFNGRYYLYKITSKWDKEKKKTRKITLELIGRITEKDGMIPKGTRKKKEIKKITNVSSKEYGASNFLKSISKDILQKLEQSFPNIWKSIFVLSVIRLLNQSPLKNMDFFYKESFLSENFKGLDFSRNTIAYLMQEIGSNRNIISSFLKQFVTGHKHIVFDTTHTFSQSKNMSKNHLGYNAQHEFTPQVNLFYMFATDEKSPIYYRTFPGNIHGIKALKCTVSESELKDVTIIGDKGFSSEENIQELQSASIDFILPLKRNNNNVNYKRLEFRDIRKAYDGYFLFQDRPIFYYSYLKDSLKYIIFHDSKLRTEEEANYLRCIDRKYDGYTQENLEKKQFTFGTIAIITNQINESCENIYEKFKARMEIETVFDVYKNLLQADRSYMNNDKSFEAWTLINHIAILMYYKILNLLKKHNMLKSTTPQDLLLKLSRIYKLNINGSWITSEINSKSLKLFEKLEIPVT